MSARRTWTRVDPRAVHWAGVRPTRPDGGLAALNDAEGRALDLIAYATDVIATSRAVALAEAYDEAGVPGLPHDLLMVQVTRECIVSDVHLVAESFGLPGGHRHWLVDLYLAFEGRYYCHGAGDWYLDAEGFLRHADGRDAADADLTGLARAQVEADARHRARKAALTRH